MCLESLPVHTYILTHSCKLVGLQPQENVNDYRYGRNEEWEAVKNDNAHPMNNRLLECGSLNVNICSIQT